MEEKLKKLILIYQKDLKLNQILKEQISIFNSYQIDEVTDEKSLIELLDTQKINLLILDSNFINLNLKLIIENFESLNKIQKLIILYDKKSVNLKINIKEIILLEKPFKVIDLLEKIEELLSPKKNYKNNIFLTRQLKFLPYEKVIINLKTNKKQHLTEKENRLLFYLYDNKNNQTTKNDLLNSVWGLSENVNTHTLETHIYRLKQKLNNVEPKVSFLLLNQNGLYSLQDEHLKSL